VVNGECGDEFDKKNRDADKRNKVAEVSVSSLKENHGVILGKIDKKGFGAENRKFRNLKVESPTSLCQFEELGVENYGGGLDDSMVPIAAEVGSGIMENLSIKLDRKNERIIVEPGRKTNSMQGLSSDRGSERNQNDKKKDLRAPAKNSKICEPFSGELGHPGDVEPENGPVKPSKKLKTTPREKKSELVNIPNVRPNLEGRERPSGMPEENRDHSAPGPADKSIVIENSSLARAEKNVGIVERNTKGQSPLLPGITSGLNLLGSEYSMGGKKLDLGTRLSNTGIAQG
jgi:hypothetical protein